ncbi:M48 family metallopeptidase [Haladaptatus sp. NG-SE-30]
MKLVYLWILLLVGVTALYALVTRIIVRNSEPERAIARLNFVSTFGYFTLCPVIFMTSLVCEVGSLVPTTLELPLVTVTFSPLLVMTTVLAVGPWFVTCLVVFLVSYAAVQQVRDTDDPMRAALRRFSVHYALVVGLPLALWYLAESAPAGLGAGIVVGVAHATFGVVRPVFVELGNETRELDSAERERIRIREADIPIRVIDTDRTKVALGLAAGLLPGYQYVYLTSYLLSELTPEAISAVVEHELAHHRRHHLRLKTALTSVALAVSASVLTANVGYWFYCLVFAISFWLCLRAISRRLEHDADRYAAHTTSESAMSDALVDLTDLNILPQNENRLDELVSSHPSLSRRLDRLGGTTAATGDD